MVDRCGPQAEIYERGLDGLLALPWFLLDTGPSRKGYVDHFKFWKI